MPQVKVWNDNRFEHVETFKGETIRIAPGGFVEMDYIDAVDFRGQYIPPKMLGPNNPDPQSFKMIRVEAPAGPVVEEKANVFHATGEAFKTTAEMTAFAQAFAKAHADLQVRDAELDRKGPSYDELLQRVAALEAQSQRGKPGPKPKVEI